MGVTEKRENAATEEATDPAEFARLRAHFYGQDDAKGSTTRSFVILGIIFIGSLLLLFTVYLSFPQLEEDEKQFVKVPKNIDDAKQLGKVLSKYKDQYYLQVLVAYFTAYVFLQSFAIPGSIFLSILSGFLFPFSLALFLVCMCSATGASFCYLLSYLVGRRLVWRYVPERAIEWSTHVQRHREHLLNYIVFLRITPFLPNWFINIVSPVINVPLSTFYIGTFIGVAPPSFVAIQAGTTLQQLTSSSDTVSWMSISILAVLAALSLLPIAFRNTLKKKFD
jgi:uncharacterized membrane protein YdjX (TVP38/TMEM64 family)